MKYTCNFCKKTFEYSRLCIFTNHVNHCIDNPNRKDYGSHPQSEEARRRISEGRKKFLKENPDKHPWKYKSKFVSKPCEDFKDFLKTHNYKFEEEASVVPNRNYSVDICFPDLMLIFEINGNQHYDMKTMELKSYYQERHNAMESLGWTVIEIPFNQAYNKDFRMGVCRQLDAKLSSKQCVNSQWEFESPHPYLKTLQEKQLEKELRRKKTEERKFTKIDSFLKENHLTKQEAIAQGRLSKNGDKIVANKLGQDELEKRKNIILSSGIDMMKFGWVGKMEKATGLSKHQIEDCVRFFNLKFFKRSSAL